MDKSLQEAQFVWGAVESQTVTPCAQCAQYITIRAGEPEIGHCWIIGVQHAFEVARLTTDFSSTQGMLSPFRIENFRQ